MEVQKMKGSLGNGSLLILQGVGDYRKSAEGSRRKGEIVR